MPLTDGSVGTAELGIPLDGGSDVTEIEVVLSGVTEIWNDADVL